MSITIALAGNPNCGKTTLFNALTGSNQFVGNWPGVTVEKKEGKLKKHSDVTVTDLPGIYSLSPYTLEEIVARNYLIDERPDVILDIIDGTNLERNLYLTTQLTELGIPVVCAINMMDIVRKNGDELDTEKLSKALGCRVVEISALKEDGTDEAAQAAIEAAESAKTVPLHRFGAAVEHTLAHIEEAAVHELPEEKQRWYSIKLFERDEKVRAQLKLSEETIAHMDKDIESCEKELDDDAESIITNERYNYVATLVEGCYKKKNAGKPTTSEQIDRIATSRYLGLPMFAAVMVIVYYVSISTIGTAMTNWVNDSLFGEGFRLFGISGTWVPGIPVLIERGLDAINCNEWLKSLVLDGIVAGVGSVLGFLPQMVVLFIFLAFLEACGYMSRVAFIMDKLFRRFGLSGKSFIPILIGTGCGVPGIMASRTIENERDRRMTIITTTFIPCGAKLPVISMIAVSLFAGAWWVGPSAYFLGMAAIVTSGLMLKKTKPFTGEPAPFVMELPPYHMPTVKAVLRSTWDRSWSFVKKAGTVILLASIVIWAGKTHGWAEGASFGFSREMALSDSILGHIGNVIKIIFAPLGFGNAAAAVATVMGLLAKEEIVGVFGVLDFNGLSPLAGYSFLVFNLLCAPCAAAVGAIRREMNSARWTAFALAYQCGFAYAVSLIIYQLGSAFNGSMSIAGLIFALAALAGIVFMVARKPKKQLKA